MQKQHRYRIKDLNWLRLPAELGESIDYLRPHWGNELGIDEALKRLTSITRQCCSRSFLRRLRGYIYRKGRVLWWSESCNNMHRGVKASRRRYQRLTQDEHLIEEYRAKYKRAQTRLKKAIGRGKWDCCKSFLAKARLDRPFEGNIKLMKGSVNYRLTLESHQITRRHCKKRYRRDITRIAE